MAGMSKLFRIEAMRNRTAEDVYVVDVSCPNCFGMTSNVQRIGNRWGTHCIARMDGFECSGCGFIGQVEAEQIKPFMGFPLTLDLSMSPHELKLQNGDGTYVLVANIGAPQPSTESTNDELNREILQLRDGLSVDVCRHPVRDIYAYPNYIDNEDFSAIILDEMPRPALRLLETAHGLSWECVTDIGSDVPGVATDPDRKRAVAKAWLAWKKAQ